MGSLGVSNAQTMNEEKAPDPSSEMYSLSFDLESPGCVQAAQILLTALSDTEGITRISLELESHQPLTGLGQTLTTTGQPPVNGAAADTGATSAPTTETGEAASSQGSAAQQTDTAASAPSVDADEHLQEVPIGDATTESGSSSTDDPADTPADAQDEAERADASIATPSDGDSEIREHSPVAEQDGETASSDESAATETETESTHVCACGETFPSIHALYGHKSSCDAEEDEVVDDGDVTGDGEDGSDGRTDTVATDAETTSVDRADEGTDTEPKSISVGTWQYKVASTLYHRDEPMTHRDMAEVLDGTAWEHDRTNLSTTLSTMAADGLLDRQERKEDNHGSNPYEYWLTEQGAEAIETAEEQARDQGVETYVTLSETEASAHPSSDADSSTDPDETAEATGAAESPESAPEAEGVEDTSEPADDASASASEASAELGASDDTEDDAAATADAEDDDPDAADITIRPKTRGFRAGSALYHASKPSTARDIADRLAESEWEQDVQNISADLSDLYEKGAAKRRQRKTDRGHPYEYELTDAGETVIEEAMEEAVDDDEATTYEEVIAGK